MAALASGDGHDHTDRHHHNATTPNFRPVGHDPMISDHYGQTAGGYLCGDAAETLDGRRLAAVESRSDVGFALVDVTDPADPEWLGEMVMENSYIYDLVVVPDGKHIVLVTAHTKGPVLPAATSVAPHVSVAGGVWLEPAAGTSVADAAEPTLRWNTPCSSTPVASDPIPREAAILLVDISDPANPAITNHHRLLGRGHSAFAVDQDGRMLVMAVTLGPDLINSWVQLFEVDTAGDVGILVPLSNYRAPLTETDQVQGNIWHDGWISAHPSRGWLLHAVGGHNYHILNVDDPRQPRPIAAWRDDDPAATGWTGNLHGVIPIYDFAPGFDIAIVGPEWGGHPEDHPTGIIRVLDISELDDVTEVGAWTLPHDVFWEDGATYQFSNHYYSVSGQTMFISMYHGGIWAVDLSPIRPGGWANLPSIGVWQPTADVQSAITVRWAPTNEEVFAFDDTIVTFDSNTGLHTATWTREPMPAPAPWPMTPLQLS